jgi:hypothetical protein
LSEAISKQRPSKKQSGFCRLATRMYDDLVGSFTKSGYVDEETQKNDLAIVKLVAEVNDVIPPQRAYEFSFVRQAGTAAKQAGSRDMKI